MSDRHFRWLPQSLIWKMLIPILVVMVLLIVSVMFYVPVTLKNYAINEAVSSAERTVAQFKVLRGYYARNVISKVISGSDLKVSFDHLDHPDTIPLPVTMVHDLSKQLDAHDTAVKLYSPYPFTNRASRELDSFANTAWNTLSEKPEGRFTQLETLPSGQQILRVAIADTMASQACVACHNSHSDSPKRDWIEGDVRGVLEVAINIDPAISSGTQLGFKLGAIIIIAIIITVTMLLLGHRLLIQKPIRYLVSIMDSLTYDSKGADNALKLETLAAKSGSANHEDKFDEIGQLYKAFNCQQQRLQEKEKTVFEYHQYLENRIALNTKQLQDRSIELGVALDQLNSAQRELIQTERLASLGSLVSGITHEVNTPLGVANTAASFLVDETRNFKSKVDAGEPLKLSELKQYLSDGIESCELLLGNLERATLLMSSFKDVAVDQTSKQPRIIDLRDYVNEILISMKPKYKHTKISINNAIPEGVMLKLQPGSLAQIIINLLTNSIHHGFDDGDKGGKIEISCDNKEGQTILVYQDNGSGMSEEVRKRAFEQFFTTRKGSGGSGIGMYLIENLVNTELHGALELDTALNKGVLFRITFPLESQVSD